MLNSIHFSHLTFHQQVLKLYYQDQQLERAWLENTNKHLPDVTSLSIDQVDQAISIDLKSITEHFQLATKTRHLKLCLSSMLKRISYTFSSAFIQQISTLKMQGIHCAVNEQNLFVFSIFALVEQASLCMEPPLQLDIPVTSHRNLFPLKERIPHKVLVIGSCFSRSIFCSSPYFNPSYKKYFEVVYTSFHNSFISMMSQPIDEDYTLYEDLMIQEIKPYVAMEFQKNIIEIITQLQPDFIIIDHYIEATAPIIQFNQQVLFTYNKYFAESIFKSNFSECEIIYPGNPKHQELLGEAFRHFAAQLKKYHPSIPLITLGGRLSRHKINLKTQIVELWQDKMDWINTTNACWDIADHIFLTEMPQAYYLDKRTTTWHSDIDSPIIGGASPSHYQNQYYKEIFYQLINLTYSNVNFH